MAYSKNKLQRPKRASTQARIICGVAAALLILAVAAMAIGGLLG